MTLVGLSLRNLRRRFARTALTVMGIAVATVLVFSVLSFDRGFRQALAEEMRRSGAHLYVSTEGCPLEAASLILHGGEIPRFLPEERLHALRRMPGVHAAAGMLIFGIPNPGADNRLDLFYGVDQALTRLRPYWKISGHFPRSADEVLLGAETAKVEKRTVGSKLYLESLDHEFVVSGILERTGTQDDSFYFLDLAAAQTLFHKPGLLTAVAVAVNDLHELAQTEQDIKRRMPDVYVITERQMTAEIQELVGASKALIAAVSLIAVVVALMSVLNTVLMSVMEQGREFGYLRCTGAKRSHILRLVLMEALTMGAAGGVLGTALGASLATVTDRLLRQVLPYAPSGSLLSLEPVIAAAAVFSALAVAAMAGLYPALRAARATPMEAVRES